MLEGRHFIAVGFSGAGTVGMVNVIIETRSQVYNVYYSTIRQRAVAPNPKGT